mmetsp:Transcript_29169/g.70374  ORF Transcript_29169/g.70374 Transcript_29169/m.70374 type:complete len:544 (+) Transcript_29169:258-1889(+)|eukprot:CAMPEP_0181097086 /NCGR_PEP_ID=MMETSP1071-20121207/11377_1 /TAXON_ID=35127 /ORGANISM="Thalassiosira sp., Strain NH16" /LENGTH=543 /DNA_ID=CAMNT_0023179535 /DNA_START=260 /DNA_END=1891 /DNA_ORIENTATION=+
MPPREGSKVRLIGLKNPDLNGKIGHVANYSRDGERVMISIIDGPQGLVKVKPKQIEVIEEPGGGGGGRPGMQRGHSSRRSVRRRSRDDFNDSRGKNSRGMSRERDYNGSRRNGSNSNGLRSSTMRRVGSEGNFRDNASQAASHSTHASVEVLETLRSADAMFELADTSGDGVVSQEEFEHYMKKHTDHDINMIRECFYMIDLDHNGDITRDEVRGAFLKKRRDLKGGGDDVSVSKKNFEEDLLKVSKDADALFDKADVDNSGTLTVREFELYMKRNTHHSDEAIHELFDTMDIDNDGFITREEVRKAYMEKNKEGGGKTSLMDLLGLDDDEMAEIEDDVYNMFFLSEPCSSSYWFAIATFILKLGLIIIIAIDLFTEGIFPDSSDVSFNVKLTQFLLLPVNVSVQEELITTFFVYANLKWSKEIQSLNPGASKCKYHISNVMRFIDGIAFLFINTTLMLQATQVLGAFLNFAALQFLSSIDNVALHLARDGYLSESLEQVAGDVLLMKLPKNHNDSLQVLDSILLGATYLATLVVWIVFTFVW